MPIRVYVPLMLFLASVKVIRDPSVKYLIPVLEVILVGVSFSHVHFPLINRRRNILNSATHHNKTLDIYTVFV